MSFRSDRRFKGNRYGGSGRKFKPRAQTYASRAGGRRPPQVRYNTRPTELKFHDKTLDDTTIDAAGSISNTLIAIPQGVTEKERVGRKVRIKSVNWRYTITIPEFDALSTPAGGDTVRVILYIDKQTNGSAAPVLDILEVANYQSFRNLVNGGRFKVLLDRTHSLNYLALASDGAGVVSGPEVSEDFTFFKKCDIPVEYSSTTGAIGEICCNNIGLLLISKDGLAGLESQFRFRYSD